MPTKILRLISSTQIKLKANCPSWLEVLKIISILIWQLLAVTVWGAYYAPQNVNSPKKQSVEAQSITGLRLKLSQDFPNICVGRIDYDKLYFTSSPTSKDEHFPHNCKFTVTDLIL